MRWQEEQSRAGQHARTGEPQLGGDRSSREPERASELADSDVLARGFSLVAQPECREEFLRVWMDLVEFAGAHSLEELMRRTLDRIAAATGSPVGFFHFVEPDQQTVSLQVWTCRTPVHSAGPRGQGRRHPLDRAGAWSECVRRRQPVVRNGSGLWSGPSGLPESAAVIRELVVPIVRAERVVALAGVRNKPSEYTETDVSVATLLADVAWQIIAMKRTDEALRERVKELRCLYSIAEVIEKGGSLEQILQMIVELLPAGWFYPESTCARLTLGDRQYRTANFRETAWTQSAEINLGGERIGALEVRYLELKPERHEGPFLKEERDLIEAIAERIDRVVERWRAQEALRRSEERFRALADNSPDIIMRYDRDLRCAFANRSVFRITGFSSGEMVGKRLAEMGRAPENAARVEQLLLEVLNSGESRSLEAPSVSQPGRWYDVRFVPERNLDGEVVSILQVARDITELKTGQAERERLLEALRETDRRKNAFISVLSHELRNPLAPIKNSLYILDHAAPGGDQARRALAVITRQVNQLARLVDDLLDLTRISRNKIQLQRQRLELNELTRRTIEDYRTLFDGASVTLELALAPSPVFVDADWNRIAQVIGNLLQNAAKFTSAGGRVRVKLRAERESRRAIIQVSDTGAGMTKEMLSRLFQPFVQEESTLDRSQGGLGLGLALVKGLVELHGGEVSASSAGLGRGSEFFVSLPLDVTAPARPAAERAAAAATRRVLIIEDNRDAAESLAEVLAIARHEVTLASSGPEGIAKARASCPDVVLCDIGLPGMSGYDVARALRAEDALKGALLVAVSGYSMPEDVQRAADAGFDCHLAKPPSLAKLEGLLGGLSAAATR